ncbi:MAG: hypothetical protein WD294_08785 [Phycisphaeraceae bacterium]
MTIAGWIIMLGSVFASTALAVWCIYKVFTTPGAVEHVHSQVDIKPDDRE